MTVRQRRVLDVAFSFGGRQIAGVTTMMGALTGCTATVLAVTAQAAAPSRSLPLLPNALPLGALTLITLSAVGLSLIVVFGIRARVALREARLSAGRLADREAHFRRMASTDPLTGLGNRRLLHEALRRAISAGSGALLTLDLDNFKGINEIYGHEAGDLVLTEVGRRIRANIRPEDLALRLGGDEFAVLIASGPETAGATAERLLDVLCYPYEMAGAQLRLSCSVGVAACADAPDPGGVMRHADLALRFAKKRGKNRVEPFDVAYDRWVQRRLAIERELRPALAGAGLTLFYQPIVALPAGCVVGAEALLRWHHPTLGLVTPCEFVPVAEEIGLIGELGAWVRQQSCRQLAAWSAAGRNIWVSVNVSVRELRTPGYVAEMVLALRASGAPPSRLVIELSEHEVAQDVEDLAQTLAALREIGVRIALDNFGAGYSSLGQLHRLPVDILKIDRTLVTDPAGSSPVPPVPLVDVIVRLGNRLGLDVIAEGVEEPRQQALVTEGGCHFAQGYLFGRPMPAERLAAGLTSAYSGEQPQGSGRLA